MWKESTTLLSCQRKGLRYTSAQEITPLLSCTEENFAALIAKEGTSNRSGSEEHFATIVPKEITVMLRQSILLAFNNGDLFTALVLKGNRSYFIRCSCCTVQYRDV